MYVIDSVYSLIDGVKSIVPEDSEQELGIRQKWNNLLGNDWHVPTELR